MRVEQLHHHEQIFAHLASATTAGSSPPSLTDVRPAKTRFPAVVSTLPAVIPEKSTLVTVALPAISVIFTFPTDPNVAS